MKNVNRQFHSVKKWVVVCCLFGLLFLNSPQTIKAQPVMESMFLPLVFNQSRHYYAAVTGGNQHTRNIFLVGQSLGNHADVFSKIGDSITDDDDFLYPIGNGDYNLYDYSDLTSIVTCYSHSIVRGEENSFSNISLAAHRGWTTGQVLSPDFADKSICNAEESPLACEYRISKPSIALILLGTNDVGLMIPASESEANLRSIIQTTLDLGIIPVLSTIPPINQSWMTERVQNINHIITRLAREYDIPLWDYYILMMPLPNYGLSSDGIHPDNLPGGAADFTPENLLYGMTVRNLSALYILQTVKAAANPEGQLQTGAAPVLDAYPYPYPNESDSWKNQPY